MILQKINRDIEKEYEKIRFTLNKTTEERRQKAISEIPEIADIDKLINMLGFLIGYAATQRRPKPEILKNVPERYISMTPALLNDEILILKKKKEDLLIKAGYKSNYLDDIYLCRRCHDTGMLYENGIYTSCVCRNRMLSERLKKTAGIPPDDVFPNFNANLYPEKADQARYGITAPPRTLMEAVYNRCVRFAEKFNSPDVKNMVFVGNAGLGKTFLANCIMNYLTDRCVPCLYMPATALFKPFAPKYYEDEDAYEKAEFIMTCELLVIDDLGSEKQTDARYSELLDIINNRSLRGRTQICKTIITTNLTPANIFSYYGERVASRILGEYDILKFAGEDIRLISKYAKL